MEDINKKIDDSIDNPFEIKNNFIPPKDQQSMSIKFDNKLDRSGKSLIENPSVETAGAFPPLATPDFTPREELNTSPLSKKDPNKKTNDTIYKRDGRNISKLDFDKFNKHNDSVFNRLQEVDKIFPMETSSMKDVMMSSRLKKDISKGFDRGTVSTEVDGKKINYRTIR